MLDVLLILLFGALMLYIGRLTVTPMPTQATVNDIGDIVVVAGRTMVLTHIQFTGRAVSAVLQDEKSFIEGRTL